MGRSAAAPGGTSISNFDNTTTSPLPYVTNSPRSTNIMNTPSPQHQSQQQTQQQQQQQQQKLMLPHHQQQLLAQQQFRQTAIQGLGQQQQDLQGQTQQKFNSVHCPYVALARRYLVPQVERSCRSGSSGTFYNLN